MAKIQRKFGKINIENITMTFRQKLSQALSSKESSFHSAYSIELALAMMAAGAVGKTRQQMCEVLELPNDIAERNNLMAARIKDMNNQKDLVIANAIWGQKGYEFYPEFPKIVKEFYNGKFSEVDYKSPKSAIKTINTWVEQQTNDKIKDLIMDLDSETVLILTNAIYFKGTWVAEFDKSKTKDEKFFGIKERIVPMMHRVGAINYYEDDDIQAVDLPYKGGDLSFLVILPKNKEPETFDTDECFAKVVNNLRFENKLYLYLPRFKLEAKYDLRDVLASMGMSIAFTNKANFSNISKELIKISAVIHKAFIEVNEEGTEAAAATAVMAVRSMSIRKTPVFRADRPFLFYIRKQKEVLFEGVHK